MKMEIILTIVSIILFANRNYAQTSDPKVVVSNLENKKGLLYIGWYTNAATFTKVNKALLFKKVNVSGQNEVSVSFDNIPAGSYAIAVFLDENANGMLDKNFLGIPKEKYGFSNNVNPAMRAAKFEESVFKVENKQETINIKLK